MKKRLQDVDEGQIRGRISSSRTTLMATEMHVVLYCKQYKGADTRYRVLWVPGTR